MHTTDHGCGESHCMDMAAVRNVGVSGVRGRGRGWRSIYHLLQIDGQGGGKLHEDHVQLVLQTVKGTLHEEHEGVVDPLQPAVVSHGLGKLQSELESLLGLTCPLCQGVYTGDAVE